MHVFLLTAFLFLCSVAQEDRGLKLLNEFTTGKERIVDELAKKAAEAFQERPRHVETCVCSRHSCSNEIGPDAKCSGALGSLPECGDCGNSTLDYTSTAVLLAPGSHPQKLSAQVRESLCTYRGLTPVFKDLDVTTWTYVASVDGTFRSYPVRHQRKEGGEEHFQGCSSFDPRVRPWYVAASTGPKDVVIVVDTSGSMVERWNLTKKALLSLLDTFTFTDYVNIVTFSDKAETLAQSTPLLAATPDNLQTLKDSLRRVRVLGGTDFNQAFQQAFGLLEEASKETAERTSSGCSKVIIFLTDGVNCCSPGELLSNIEDRQVDLEAKTGSRALVFTFSMGRDADDSVPKQIACANNGAWSFFEDGEDPLLKLNSYYTFLAAARYPGRSTWITPFDDAFGLGRLTSVAKPVYSPNGRNGTTGAMIAVVGHDVELKELELANVPSDTIVEELASLSRGCDELNLGGCQLQVQRDHSVDHATCPDRLPKKKCYEFRRRWYQRVDDKSSWYAAKTTCKEKGGKLVSIRSDQHLSFIASLSSPEGSWVGGRTSSEREFSWEAELVAPLSSISDYWARSPAFLSRDSCAKIDPRGVKRNMLLSACDDWTSFICEFESKPKFCKRSVGKVDPDSFFEVPPLSQCRDEEDFLGRLRPLPQAESITPAQALCPLGKRKRFEDLVCCEGCSNAQEDRALSQQKLLTEFTTGKERIVDELAKKAAEAFQERPRHMETCACSRHSCSNEIGPGAKCSDALGSLPECGDCGNSTLDYTSTAVLLAPRSHPEKLSAQVRESLCTYRGLTPIFRGLNVTTWTYVASVDGTFRSYPVRHRRKNGEERHFQGCSTYDPRVRPWYVAASTGPKDVVIVVDTSGSMVERWNLTKKALLSLLDTFTFTDYVNIVTFSDEVKTLAESTPLLAATPENLQTLKDSLRRVRVDGGTDFNQAFQQAFGLLEEASKETAERTSSGCSKVIIFLTDGRDCSLSTTPSACSIPAKNGPGNVLSNIESRQVDLEAKTGFRALLFTFSMGHDADDSVPKQIACANDGAWSFFEDGEDPLLKLNSYYTFLAAARYPGRSTWIAPYEDAFGFGRLTSVAKPVYSPNGRNGTTGALIAVVGHDVELKELELANVPSDTIVEELASLSRGCDKLNLGGCQLQVQRDHSVDHATCPDRLPKKKCYEFRRRWYQRFDDKSSWSSAKEMCEEKGGKLVSIRSDQHLSFIASLSSPWGSWVGAFQSKAGEFTWLDESVTPLSTRSEYWGTVHTAAAFAMCASIDPRGVKRNMEFKWCQSLMSFICEYESKPESCEGSVGKVDPDSFFEVPPLSQCRDEEDFLGRLRPIPKAESMESSQALCPLGKRKRFKDLVCCEGCSNG
ncbi:hypothetical protein BSKO_06516 [Bryopsis sp. KO-2023]|nr:hypothetical protein BSKO_06516 [Bryopsis sp. KO-2023]